MATPRVLLLGEFHHDHADWNTLRDSADRIVLKDVDKMKFIQDCKGGVYDGVLVISRSSDSLELTGPFNEELVSALPQSIFYIVQNSGHYHEIDVQTCSRRGKMVSNAANIVDNAVAHIAMFLVLGALRRVWIASSSIRSGQWQGDMELGHDPRGKMLGIIGMEGVGTALAQRAAAFDMKIQFHNHQALGSDNIPIGTRRVALAELLRISDIISVHVPLSEHTRHLIITKEFAQMKDGVVIINTAYGAVIDENALVQALASGKVYSAGLDVFEKEPNIHPKLLDNENVVLLPRIGSCTYETQISNPNC